MNQIPIIFKPEEKDFGQRLDVFLSLQIKTLSRNRIQSLIKKGHVSQEGISCREPKMKLKDTKTLSIIIPDAEEAAPKAENIPLNIIYEDDDIIVINKPAGLVVHPAPGHHQGTLVNALLHHCKGSLSGIGGVIRPGIVHRLDKETSGVMIAAKNDHAHQHLSAQFADHGRTGLLERRYKALIWDTLKRKTLTINAPIGRAQNNREKQTIRQDGKQAITHIHTLEKFLDPGDKKNILASLIECRLETGRTHQIRVHMAHVNCPLIGDTLYGNHYMSKINKLKDKTHKALSQAQEIINRQALHAYFLQIEHPTTAKKMNWQSDVPQDFQKMMTLLKEKG